MKELLSVSSLTVSPVEVCLYVPPIVWKGDAAGHIGVNDLFFFVLEGACFLRVEDESYIIEAGQMAFLPKGKLRAYTHTSETFSMYEMAFTAEADGENLMERLGLSGGSLVVTLTEPEKTRALFEGSQRKELRRDPLYDIGTVANVLNVIRLYARERRKRARIPAAFAPVLAYMSVNMEKPLRTEELSAMAFMQTTYFIRQFKKAYGLPPLAYLNRMRIFRAMGLLSGTELPVEEIAKRVGFEDASYFARVFKKTAGISPSRYRTEFKKEGVPEDAVVV